ncbi:MAG: TonB-dependent receptor [Tannerella sp.]|nr:TonB-dependent receptor [Tannerella sp.]
MLPVIMGSLFLLANTVSAETAAAQQQTARISGKIVDSSGEPLIGASVVEKGTTNGVTTDIDGNYTLNVAPDATVEVSFIGFLPASFKVVSGRSVYDLQMQDDTQSLEEVVVVGYGVQKKKLVTGATIQVSGENIQRMSTTNAFTALQSQTPGVNIVQKNGQPGDGYIVNIRGLGTNGESRPLYVIDGVPAGNDALNQMSPADIETIDILKDAASAAIYGSRAANGVILITTRQGKAGKPRISYDAYYGQQYMVKRPDVLNAKEYIQIMNERQFNENLPLFDWDNLLPDGMYDKVMSGEWTGTNWIDEMYNEGAVKQNHSFNVTGGGDYSKFSMGYSYTQQDGILGGPAQSKYNRHTFRVNSDHVLLKVRDFDAITVGETLNSYYRSNHGISTGNIYWNAFHSAIVANPLLPAYDAEGNYYDYYDKMADGWTLDGGAANPVGSLTTNSQGLNFYRSYGLRASAYLQIQPIKGLIFKSLYGYNMSANSGRTQSQISRWNTTSETTTERVDQNQSMGYDWNLTNTLTYSFSIDKNNITALVGQEIAKGGYGENVSAGANISKFNMGWNYAWVDNTDPTSLAERSAGGNPWGEGSRASFFGRLMYDYNETYMATLILRADGSSNFMRGNRWGYFPSISAGWIISNEAFMEGLKGTVDFLRLNANWGRNGNDAISNFQYLSQYKYDNGAVYFFGGSKQEGTEATGAIAGVLKNPDVTWETQQMTDIGLDARFLRNRLGLTFNYYIRETKGWLLDAPISATWGFDRPKMNGGAVRNNGAELSLSWNDKVGDFTYGINLGGDYNKNEVTEIENVAGVINGPDNLLSQGTTFIYRLQVGQPMGYFYVYKTDGILQNQAEADAYNKATGSNSRPGDVRFVDTNGLDENGKLTGKPDGKIDPNDRTNIGNSNPTSNLRLAINLGYKGFDFSVNGMGSFGHLIAKSYRRFADSHYENYTTDVFERWVGEGTSNKWPRLTTGNHPNYQLVSDIFFEKGDFFRIQNITLGYDFKQLFPKMPMGRARIFVSAENLLTFTGYSGVDPENAYSGDDNIRWASHVDLGMYPAAKSFLAGVNLTF